MEGTEIYMRGETYANIFDKAQFAAFVIDRDARVTYLNRAAQNMLGFTLHQEIDLVSMRTGRYTHGGKTFCANISPVHINGQMGSLAVLWEITEEADNGQHGKKEEYLALALAQTEHEVWECDLSTGVCTPLLGEKEGQLSVPRYLKSPSLCVADGTIHPEDCGLFLAFAKAISQAEGQAVGVFRVKRNDGQYGWLRCAISTVFNAQGKPSRLIGAYEDIDAKKKAELAMQNQAELDFLTGIRNREATIGYIDAQLEEGNGTEFALYMVDIDHFKHINDRFGHIKGDEVLRNCVAMLVKSFPSEAFLGRLGGDEFVVFMPLSGGVSQAERYAEAACVSLRFEVGGVQVAASIGLSISPRNGLCFNDLYEKADKALYHAKDMGKNRYAVYDVGLRVGKGEGLINEESLIDELDEIMYISDVETHELIYINRAGRKAMGIAHNSYYGKKCYQAIQNRDTPCPFCTNAKLTYDAFYEWEYTNPVLRRHFALKDKLVDWHGHKARMEFAFDITEKEAESQLLSKRLEIEQVLVKAIRAGFDDSARDQIIMRLLEGLGEFHGADRAYVFELGKKGDQSVNLCQWCAPGIRPREESLLKFASRSDTPWCKILTDMQPISWEDVSLLKEQYPAEFGVIEGENVYSQYLMPFGREKGFTGVVAIENPTKHVGDTELLASITYFISSEMVRQRLDRRMHFINRHDPLTGLANRNSFAEYLLRSRERTIQQLGVLVVDINGLKQLNRDFGHPYGDTVVCKVAETLRTQFPGDQVYRMSGDEFVALSESLSQAEFFSVVDSLKIFLAEIEMGASVGSIWSRGDAAFDIEEMVRQADERLVIEKREYYKNAAVISKRVIPEHEGKLRESLEKGEFFVVLQPKANIVDDSIVGAEALIRFRDEAHGLVYPDKFIPLLEKIRCIHLIDLYVFEIACQILTRWQAEGRRLIPISVNFSRSTMIEPDIIERMGEILSRYAIQRSLIQIEVTESFGELELSSFSYTGRVMKEMGFGLALDDYGSHYNNTAMIVSFPMDVLKIDRKIICSLEEDKRACVVVSHVIQMCFELGIEVVAEGVETLGQKELLRSLGCHYVQGFLYSKPIPVPEFEKIFLLQ